MAKDDSSTTSSSKVPASLGMAKVQDPTGPDVLDANNTGRIGDAREYDALRLQVAAPAEGFKAGQVAPETRYADQQGNLVSSADAGAEGFRGSVVVAKGDVVNTSQAAQLQA